MVAWNETIDSLYRFRIRVRILNRLFTQHGKEFITSKGASQGVESLFRTLMAREVLFPTAEKQPECSPMLNKDEHVHELGL